MIKIENVEVSSFKAAIRGMRNAYNSWNKSDTRTIVPNPYRDEYELNILLGDEDEKLMSNLVEAGTDHSKFARLITVTCDITAPRYWWIQADQYKVGTVSASTSTMHTIANKEFTLNDFSFEHGVIYSAYAIEQLIEELNSLRNTYLTTKDKGVWYAIIQLLPQSYNQMRTIQLNYQVLRNIYHARKNHKLNEWKEFCKWIEFLPYADALITGENNI